MKLQKEIKLNSRIIIAMILVIVIIIGISSSYALFQTSVKLDNAIKIETADKMNLDNSGLNFPVVFSNLIPIYNQDNKIIKADQENLNKNFQWYDYRKSNLASAVTVKNNQEYIIGTNYENYISPRNYKILDDGNLYLNGYGNFYELGYADYDFGHNISIVMRVKFHRFSNASQFLIGNGEGTPGIRLSFTQNKNLYFTVNSVIVAASKDPLNLDTWYTIVLTYDGIDGKIFIDGNLEGTAKYSEDIININVPLVLGGDAGQNGIPNQSCSNITISNTIVYTDTLTNEEITSYFDGEISNYPTDNILVDVGTNRFATNQKHYEVTNNNEVYFDGINDFLILENHPEQFTNQVSMITRVKFHKNGLNKAQEFFGNWESGGGGLKCNSEDKIGFEYYIGDNYQSLVSNQKCEIETWYTIVGVYDGSYEHIYINGEEAGDPIAITGNIKNSLAPFALGINPKALKIESGLIPGSGNTNVTISDAFVYRDAISKEEVENYFKNEISDYPKDNLVFGYRGFKESTIQDCYTNIKAGVELIEDDIIATYDWIPRYSLVDNKIKYIQKVGNIDTRDIAFNYNNKELLGYWITKDNVNINNLDANKYNLHNVTTNEVNAANKLKGTTEEYTKSICVYGN